MLIALRTVSSLCTLLPVQDQWTNLTSGAGTPPPGHEDACAAYDSRRRRLLMFGGQVACGGGSGQDAEGTTNSVWALDLDQSGALYLNWKELVPNIDDNTKEGVTVPQSREDSAAVYDIEHDAFVLFGGDLEGRGPTCGVDRSNDTWSLNLTRLALDPGNPEKAWKKLQVTGAIPPKSKNHTAIFDPYSGEMHVYGEQMGPDVYSLDLDALVWVHHDYSGGSGVFYPESREQHVSAYDPWQRRMLVFAGTECNSPPKVWALKLEELHDADGSIEDDWVKITPSSGPHPPCRKQAVSGFDTLNNHFLIFGGQDFNANLMNDTWALVLDPDDPPVRWVELLPGDPDVPKRRFDHTGAYDDLRKRFFVFAGDGEAGGLADTWELRHCTVGAPEVTLYPRWRRSSASPVVLTVLIRDDALFDLLPILDSSVGIWLNDPSADKQSQGYNYWPEFLRSSALSFIAPDLISISAPISLTPGTRMWNLTLIDIDSNRVHDTTAWILGN